MGRPQRVFSRYKVETDPDLVHVLYRDHLLFHRSDPDVMAPQIRECWGRLHYACDEYVIVVWDRDAGPPTLKGGDPKADGLLILRPNILELRRLNGD